MKLDIDLLSTEYNDKVNEYESLAGEVKFFLQKGISRNKIKIDSIKHRIKSFDSFLDKIRRENVEEPFKEIHDLIGIRIICLFRPDLELIGEMIRKEFDVFDEDNKINNSEVNVFGYMSLHYKARFRKNSGNQGLDSMIYNPFEIQVRTIAQDAWASVSHYLDYKPESSLPEQLRRDLYALSGLFYVADTNFSLLRQEQLKSFIDKTLNEDDNTAVG
jgi:putative GTP pyrophosphokinase